MVDLARSRLGQTLQPEIAFAGGSELFGTKKARTGKDCISDCNVYPELEGRLGGAGDPNGTFGPLREKQYCRK